jgi:general secretion pathway protein D
MKHRFTLTQPHRPLVSAVAASLLCLSMAPASLVYAQSASASQAQAQANAKKFKGEPVTLNFVNADIEGVSRAMGAILKQQFIVDPRVKGTVTLYSDTPLSPREAYLNYLAALRGLGFTVVESGGLFKVVPEADAKLQTGTVATGDTSRRGDQILTQIFRINHENANNLVPVLRPLISPNNTINANPGNNTLVITDYADNLQRIAKIIAAMDTPGVADVEVIQLKHAVAADVATMVQRLSDSPAAAGAPATAGTSPSVIVDPRANALIVRAPNAARMAHIKALVEKLDRPTEGGNAAGNMYVVYLKNADAVRLATVLRAAFSNSGGGASSLGGGGASGQPQNPTLANATGNAANSATGASAQATAPLTAAGAPSTGGMIQADPASNALLITAPEPVYRQLRAVIDQLDSRRAQVYVESLIVEVDPSQAASLGIQWQALGNTGNRYIGGAGTNFGTTGNILTNQGATSAIGALAGLGAGGNIGLIRNFGGTDGFGLAAIASALATQTGTNILSTPNLVTLDNEEAKIVVGQNVPFVTGSFTSTGTGTANPFQTIERKDVGITLRIRPQIGENGTVRMLIFQESSSVATTTAVGTDNAGPTTNKRSIESTIVVDDGQIIVLGGLIEDTYSTTRSKVPLLGDIPYLGALFRSESRERKKTNLMVFLRPVVMRDQSASNKVSLDRYDYIRSEQLRAQPTPNSVLGINESPLLPPVRPEITGPTGVPPPLGDSRLPPSPAAPSTTPPPPLSPPSTPSVPAPAAPPLVAPPASAPLAPAQGTSN